MIEFIQEYWFWICAYWMLWDAWILNWYSKNIEEKGPMKPLTALIVMIITPPFAPLILAGLFIAGFMKAGKGPDDS